MKTNAVRILEEALIRYELREYDVDPSDLSAETVAREIGLPAAQVFKTLLARGDRNGFCFAVIPGDAELNLRALARITADRSVELAPMKELQSLTGYIRGGVTVLAAKREYPVYVDETAILYDRISISAGVRGTQILLDPNDYIGITNAVLAGISSPKPPLESMGPK